MASSQQAANISEKNKAILYALKNEIKASNGANNMLASNGALLMASNNVPAGALNALAQSQATTTMNMSNMGVGQMIVHDKFDWSGSVLGSYPTINTMNTRNFIHRGVPPKDPQGSYGCVIYAGPNVQGGANNCAWVLAWKVLGDGSPNKIYVETGVLSKYPKGSVNWDAIKASLERSGNESQNHDALSGAEASALIDESGNFAAASALFTVSL